MGHTVQRVAAPARTTAAFSDAGACPPFVKSELDVASPENDTGTRFDIDESHPVSDRSLPCRSLATRFDTAFGHSANTFSWGESLLHAMPVDPSRS
jgi:hypothetical protein